MRCYSWVSHPACARSALSHFRCSTSRGAICGCVPVIQDKAAFYASACHMPGEPPAPPAGGGSVFKVVVIVVVIMLVLLLLWVLWRRRRGKRRRRSVVITSDQAASFFGSSTRELSTTDCLLPSKELSRHGDDSSSLEQQRRRQQELFEAQSSVRGGATAPPGSSSASINGEWEERARQADAEVVRLRTENEALRQSLGVAAPAVQSSANVKSARQMFLEQGGGGGTVTVNTSPEVAKAAMAAASWAPAESMGHAAVMGALEESVEVKTNQAMAEATMAAVSSAPAESMDHAAVTGALEESVEVKPTAAPPPSVSTPEPSLATAEDSRAQRQAELALLSARALLKLAEKVGIEESKIECADEADDRKGALTALLLEFEDQSTQAVAPSSSQQPSTQQPGAMAPCGQERVAPSFSVMGGSSAI